jgi:hypothetical protein
MRMPANAPAGGARSATAHTFAALAVVFVRLFTPLHNGRVRATAVADLVKAVALEHLVELNLREAVAADERVVAADGAGTALLERGVQRPLASPRNHRFVLYRHLFARQPRQTRSRRLPVLSRAANSDTGEKLARHACGRGESHARARGTAHRTVRANLSAIILLSSEAQGRTIARPSARGSDTTVPAGAQSRPAPAARPSPEPREKPCASARRAKNGRIRSSILSILFFPQNP